MTISLLLLASLLASPAAPPDTAAIRLAAPPVLTLKAARSAALGSTVTVRAVVLNGAELGNIRYVQDAQAGLALYSHPSKLPGYGDLQAGDSILATGQLKTYNGLLEMDPISSFQKLGKAKKLRTLRVPVAQVAGAMVEANEGRLVEITGVTRLTNPAGAEVASLAGNSNYFINALPTALVRVASTSTGPTGLVDVALPTKETYAVRGILSQFSPGGTGGYQLLPRVAADIVRGGGLPRLLEEAVPIDIRPDGFTLVFSTLNPGDTRVRYGVGADDLRHTQIDTVLTTRHSITLTNLIPGATYYVEVSSRNAEGTVTAQPVPVIMSSKKRGRTGTKN